MSKQTLQEFARVIDLNEIGRPAFVEPGQTVVIVAFKIGVWVTHTIGG